MTPSETLRQRIYNVLPAGTYQMHKLLTLMDVVITHDVPTAAVEVSESPRLLVNPDFVSRHCVRDEHLFLLIMHELYHVILGHTRLFKRVTLAHNLAFDAIINAMLARQFPGMEFDGFLEAINDWETFPSRLLRPPPSWRANRGELIHAELASLPAKERALVRQLYGQQDQTTTFHEVFEALTEKLTRAYAKGRAPDGFVLIGDHADDSREKEAIQDEHMTGILRRIVEGWPPPPMRISGRDQGRIAELLPVPSSGSRHQTLEKEIRRFLRRAGVYMGSRGPRHWKWREDRVGVETVLPDWRDRRQEAVARLWGSRPLLYRSEISQRRQRRVPMPVAHVYLDVSGSMTSVLPFLASALDRPHREGLCRVYVFSTVIDEVPPRRLLTGSFKNTGGTEINCVLEHALSLPASQRPRRIAVLSDGYVGTPASQHLLDMKKHGMELHVALTGGDFPAYTEDLAPHAASITTLPPIQPGAHS